MEVGSIAAGYPSFRPNPASADKPTASATESGGAASSVAFYPSPIYQIDPLAKVTVMEFRDTSTGAVTNQYPSAKVVEQYRRQREAGAAQTGDKTSNAGGIGVQSGTDRTVGTGASTTAAASVASASTYASTTTPAAQTAAVVPAATVAAASVASASKPVSIHA